MGIPALKDGLSIICKFVDFRLFILYICVWERKREAKREGKKGKEKEREKEGKGKREANYEHSEGTLMRNRVYRYTRLHCKSARMVRWENAQSV